MEKIELVENIIGQWDRDLTFGKEEHIRDFIQGLSNEEIEKLLVEKTCNNRQALEEIVFYQLVVDLKYSSDVVELLEVIEVMLEKDYGELKNMVDPEEE